MKIKVWYLGKRFINDKLYQRFQTEKGEEFSFQGTIKGVFAGYGYVAEKKGENVSIRTRPDQFGNDPHPDAQKWMVLEHAAIEQWKAFRLKKRASQLPDLMRDLTTIKKFCKGLRHTERRAFIEWIVDELEREENERFNREMNERIKRIARSAQRQIKQAQKKSSKPEPKAAGA